MTNPIITPFEGDPRTERLLLPDATIKFRMYPRELTPLRAWFADKTAGTLSFLGGLEGALVLYERGTQSPWSWSIALGAPFIGYAILLRVFRALLKRPSQIELTGPHFRFKQKGRWQTYDRRLSHRFSLHPHRLGRKEQQSHQKQMQLAARRGQTLFKKAYYAESYHLVFEYLGQAQEIVSIYDRERALKVLNRLKACDEVLNNEVGSSDGIALDPEEQWTEGPGDIPETE